jgi:beta-lactamase superfamily II metal-dependent hydrolase
MTFTIEALEAKHGDALLLRWGGDRLALIDGGPSRAFESSVEPRLTALRQERDVETLPIRLLMVSHIDDDHIHGILDLTSQLADACAERRPLPWHIEAVWHNAFDDIVGNVEPLSMALSTVVRPVMLDHPLPHDLVLDRYSALVVASVPQARQLRDDLRALQTCKAVRRDLNHPWKGLISASANGARQCVLEEGLTLTVIGPLEAQVEALQQEWDKKLEIMKKKSAAEAQAIAAEFVDRSVYNLSSIVVLASLGGRRILLTGDARGDFIVNGLNAMGLLQNDTIHVDLLKVPHHGSDRNVTCDFFRQVTADHYVISADGRYGNPDPKMLRMLAEARGLAEYVVHFTNRVPAAEAFYEADRPKNRNYEVVYRDDSAASVVVALDG